MFLRIVRGCRLIPFSLSQPWTLLSFHLINIKVLCFLIDIWSYLHVYIIFRRFIWWLPYNCNCKRFWKWIRNRFQFIIKLFVEYILNWFCYVLENSTEEISEELCVKLSHSLKKKQTEYDEKVFPKHVVDSVKRAAIET